MKKILSYLAASLLFMSLFVSTGCEDDTTDPPEVKDPPILSLSSTDLDISNAATFELSNVAPVSFTLIATAGTDLIQSLRVNGVDPVNDLVISGNVSGIASNLIGIVDESEKLGFSWDVTYTPTSTLGDQSFSFQLTDEGGLSSGEIVVTISVIEDSGTPIDTTLVGVLFNKQNSAAGTGSLDLDEGKGSGVTSDGEVPSTEAEIRDLGIDCTIDPAVESNWRRQIGGFNGTELRTVDLTQLPETFSFDGVQLKEDIQNAFDTGTSGFQSDSVDPFCNVTGTVDFTSDPLSVGDMLVVKKNDTYYLIRVDVINEDGGAGNTNDDNYELSIKH